MFPFSRSIDIVNKPRVTQTPVSTPNPSKIAEAIGSHETNVLFDKNNKPIAVPTDFQRYSYTQPFSNALGKYQVQPTTLQVYAPKLLGKSISNQEFLANPKLQDQFVQKYVGHLLQQGLSYTDAIKAYNTGINGDFNSQKANNYLTNVAKYLK